MTDQVGRICECGISHEGQEVQRLLEAAEKADKARLPVWRQRLTARDETGRILAPERPER